MTDPTLPSHWACSGDTISHALHTPWPLLAAAILAPHNVRADEPRARTDYTGSVSLGISSARMDNFNGDVAAYQDALVAASPGIELGGVARSGVTWSIESRFRVYLPRYALVETGLDFLIHHAHTDVTIGTATGTLGYRNLAIQLPLLIGMYRRIASRSQLYIAGGPTLLLHAGSTWNYSMGQVSDHSSSRGGGIEAMMGGDIRIFRGFSLIVFGRYRYLRTTPLSVHGPEYLPLQDLGGLDFAGFGITVGVRWHSQ
jgi:hypothetical protein